MGWSSDFDYERNCLSYWYPKLKEAGLRVPRTSIIRTESDLSPLLDGQHPEGWDEFHALVQAACYDHGVPCFLRTGQGSGKHQWSETCYVDNAEQVGLNIYNLVEWSHGVDMMGLPHDVWAIRDLIDTEPLFRCRFYAGFPVTREFRVFMRDDEFEHMQPYWPEAAIEEGEPDNPRWRELLFESYVVSDDDSEALGFLSGWAVGAVGGGYWSVDLLQDKRGEWWLTDMALGERSFRWEPDASLLTGKIAYYPPTSPL